MTNATVSFDEFVQTVGAIADRAVSAPVIITRNGHDRLVLLSAEEYTRLKRRDRRVRTLADMTEADLAAIAASEVSAEHAHLDAELEGWQP